MNDTLEILNETVSASLCEGELEFALASLWAEEQRRLLEGADQ